MPVYSEIDREKDLTILTFTGELSAEEILSALKAFWEGEVTLNVLGDVRGATGKGLSSEDMEVIANSAADYSYRMENRRGGKSAIVASADFEFGLARMLEILRGMRGFPFELKVFRSIEEANDWLEGK